jgi:hypothetical protein
VLDLRSGLIDTSVTVQVDSQAPVALGDTTISEGLIAAGTHHLTVRTPGNTVTVPLQVPAGSEVTALVYREPSATKGGPPGNINVIGVPFSGASTPTGESSVAITNASQFGGGEGFDVNINGKRVATQLTDTIAKGPQTATIDLPAGPFSLTVLEASNTSNVLATLPGRFLLTGLTVQLYIVGNPVSPSTLTILSSARTLGVGYRLYASDGGVFDYGDAGYYGSLGGIKLNKPIVGAATDNLGLGYWMVASDGGVFTFGDAGFYGSTGGIALNKPIVGMAADPHTGGYWLVASDGGIFSFNAPFFGSTGGIKLNQPIVGMAVTPDGGGYWLVASDGGIFSFGDAKFFGSTGGIGLNQPVVGMAPTLDGRGYWLVASDGGIFSFGDAAFFGSTGGIRLNKPVVGMFSTPDSLGYVLVASDGGIFTYGDGRFYGSTGGIQLNEPVVYATLPASARTQ